MKAVQIVLIEDNAADVYLIELALKENGISHELTKFKTGDEGVQFLCSSTMENEFHTGRHSAMAFAALARMLRVSRLSPVKSATGLSMAMSEVRT
jgi:CheY-like chemotaxis protein